MARTARSEVFDPHEVAIAHVFHLVLRSRPDVVATWNDTEVARRWLMICPVRKDRHGEPLEPSDAELNSIRNDPDRLALIRRRLSDISWWMRLLSQPLAAGLPETLAQQRTRRTQRRWHTPRGFQQLFGSTAA